MVWNISLGATWYGKTMNIYMCARVTLLKYVKNLKYTKATPILYLKSASFSLRFFWSFHLFCEID